MTSVRERILAATFDCVGRHGIAKTTVEDAARAAGVSRATVYRHFPGGKDEIIGATVAWEVGRFFERLSNAVGDREDIVDLLEESLVFARQAVLDHEVLQKVLETEPERLLPVLTHQSEALLALVAAFLRPALERTTPRRGLTVEQAGAYLARAVLSLVQAPGRWDLADPAQVRDVVRTELLGGLQ